MSSDFISGTVLTAEALNATFGHHVDCGGFDQMYGPLWMWDGDGAGPDGTDYMQGACRGWVRDQIIYQMLNPPDNILFLPIVGGTLQGSLTLQPGGTLTPQLTLSGGPSGSFAGIIQSQRPGSSARWQIEMGNAGAETGANAGSQFNIIRFDDNGLPIPGGIPLYIVRATGVVSFALGITTGGASASTLSGTFAGNPTFTGQPNFGISPTTGNPAVISFNGDSGTYRRIMWKTAGVARWTNDLITAESTGDLGSDWTLFRFSDAGANSGAVISFKRSTGATTFGGSGQGVLTLSLGVLNSTPTTIGVSGTGGLQFVAGTKVGFNGATPPTKPTVTGAKGSNAALGSLLTALAAYGLITDSSTA